MELISYPINIEIEEETTISIEVEDEQSIPIDMSTVEYVELLPDPIDLIEYNNTIHEQKYYFIKG